MRSPHLRPRRQADRLGEPADQEPSTPNQPAAVEISRGYLYATVNVLAGLGFSERQTPFAPRVHSRRAGPAGKLVRWQL